MHVQMKMIGVSNKAKCVGEPFVCRGFEVMFNLANLNSSKRLKQKQDSIQNELDLRNVCVHRHNPTTNFVVVMMSCSTWH